MINHYRTALLNISGSNWPGLEYPGEELVDPMFRQKPMSSYASTVHRLIFGESPDRAYLNYRLRQLTTMWHDGTLLYEVTAKDSRLTYWPMQFASTMAGYGVVKVDGVNSAFAADYSVLNVPFADDKLGRSQFILDLKVSGDTCDVIDERTGNKYTVASSGSYFNLLNDIKISLGNGHYRATAFLKPAKDMGQVLVDCEDLIGSDVELWLFSGKEDLRQLWRRSDFLADKMGALSLALAIEMDKIELIKILQGI
jgi:hypothetical protein